MPTVLRLVYSRFSENPCNKLELETEEDDSQSVEFIQDVPLEMSTDPQAGHLIKRPAMYV